MKTMSVSKMSVSKKLLLAVCLLLVLLVAGVHVFVPAPVENQFNKYQPHPAYTISESARSLHAELFVADLHSDSMLWKREFLDWGDRGHMDLPRLQAGNVGLQIFAATTKSPAGQNYQRNSADSDNITLLSVAQLQPPSTWLSLYERAAWQVAKLHDLEAASGGSIQLVKNASDLKAIAEARKNGQDLMGAIFAIEGAHPLEGQLENLDRLQALGLRILGLTHFFDNRLGGSLHGESQEGLTAFGRQVIERANALNLIVDVAHASPQMVRDVLAIVKKPVILSHGGIKSACDNHRNLDDEIMKAIADSGGLLGVGYWEGAVCDITPEGIVKSIRAAINIMGLDHVALGSDYDGATTVAMDTSELAALTQAMMDAGFSEMEIRQVMGGNALTFFIKHLPAG